MDNFELVVLFVLFVLLIIFGPFFTVWSLNHLFGTEIEMSFKTWCAIVWLATIARGVNFVVKRERQ